jgi:hypothetical protein
VANMPWKRVLYIRTLPGCSAFIILIITILLIAHTNFWILIKFAFCARLLQP